MTTCGNKMSGNLSGGIMPSNYMNSYNLAEHLIADWLEGDTDDLKADIKNEVMDWLENYVTSIPELEKMISEAAEQDGCDKSEARSSIEDGVNDWLDEHLFK